MFSTDLRITPGIHFAALALTAAVVVARLVAFVFGEVLYREHLTAAPLTSAAFFFH